MRPTRARQIVIVRTGRSAAFGTALTAASLHALAHPLLHFALEFVLAESAVVVAIPLPEALGATWELVGRDEVIVVLVKAIEQSLTKSRSALGELPPSESTCGTAHREVASAETTSAVHVSTMGPHHHLTEWTGAGTTLATELRTLRTTATSGAARTAESFGASTAITTRSKVTESGTHRTARAAATEPGRVAFGTLVVAAPTAAFGTTMPFTAQPALAACAVLCFTAPLRAGTAPGGSTIFAARAGAFRHAGTGAFIVTIPEAGTGVRRHALARSRLGSAERRPFGAAAFGFSRPPTRSIGPGPVGFALQSRGHCFSHLAKLRLVDDAIAVGVPAFESAPPVTGLLWRKGHRIGAIGGNRQHGRTH